MTFRRRRGHHDAEPPDEGPLPLTPSSVWLHRAGLAACIATTVWGVPLAVMVAVTAAVFSSLPQCHRRQVIGLAS